MRKTIPEVWRRRGAGPFAVLSLAHVGRGCRWCTAVRQAAGLRHKTRQRPGWLNGDRHDD